jgi:hypothetical protein
MSALLQQIKRNLRGHNKESLDIFTVDHKRRIFYRLLQNEWQQSWKSNFETDGITKYIKKAFTFVLTLK